MSTPRPRGVAAGSSTDPRPQGIAGSNPANPRPKGKPKNGGSKPPKGKNKGLTKKQIDKIEQEYGLSYALFQAFPELNNLLQKAVKAHWTAAKFQVELRQSDWFKTHSDVWRKNTALKYADPETYNQRLNQTYSQFTNLASSVGVHLSPGAGRAMAERALLFGWDEGQIRDVLAGYVTPSATGDYGGDLAGIEHNLNTLAHRNGIKLSGSQMQSWMQSIARGDASEDELQNSVRNIAAQTFSLYGDQIRGGSDLADIASPYVQAMASTLELNPGDLDLFDPSIRKALTGVRDDKGEYQPMSVTAFEDTLRQDKRWQYTQTAQDQARGYVAALGQAWGLS